MILKIFIVEILYFIFFMFKIDFKKRSFNMKKVFLVSFFSILISINAYAGVNCSTDNFGNTTCKNQYGNVIGRSHTDSFGNTTYKDQYGNVTGRSHTDNFGNTTYKDQYGNVRGRSSTDNFGNTRFRNQYGY